MATRDQFRSLTSLSKAIVVLLWIDIAASVAFVVATLGFMSHVRGRIAEDGPGARYDDTADLVLAEVAQLLVALVVMLLAITLVVMIGRWIYRAGSNVRHLGAKRLTISPGMAVGWYFVPFANLVMPFRAMREIWLASHDPLGWRMGSVGVISGWWGFWLLAGLVHGIGQRAYMAVDTLQQLHTTEIISIAGYTLSICANLLFIRVVQGVQRAQDLGAAGAGQAHVEPPADASPASVEA